MLQQKVLVERQKMTMTSTWIKKIHIENPYGDVYINVKSNSYIAVQNLGNEISEKSRNENDGFKKEYAVC